MTSSRLGSHRGQVDEALHGWQRSDLAARPASLPLPQAAGRSDAQPAVTPRFPDDALVVVHVGDSANRSHARLQNLGERFNLICVSRYLRSKVLLYVVIHFKVFLT